MHKLNNKMKNKISSVLLAAGLMVLSLFSCDKKVESSKINLITKNLELSIGQTAKLEVSVTPTGPLSFLSLDESIASVDKNGIVKAQGKGETFIQVKASKAQPERVKITVKEWESTPPKGSELPIVKLFFKDKEELIGAVGPHELALGRQPALITVVLPLSGFLNKENKVVTATIYDQRREKGTMALTFAFLRKNWDDHPEVATDLEKMGFVATSKDPVKGFLDEPCYQWSRMDGIKAEIVDDKYREELNSNSLLIFYKKK
ncbi:Uncharacterised protein [Porphyromonas crevioricanis]|uniref:BIG2 domain-containing protein n=2 Tax=Porphyromonas crevioricanis TaxID=393921 RepID=A0A2X4PFV2_9PORP|nr:hypothetical protein PORCAN_2229 [Porphyromonas crevioricanis JCM 13913]SQH72714.1 Uncharacterised protein [Porphyromonas crevioricanis]